MSYAIHTRVYDIEVEDWDDARRNGRGRNSDNNNRRRFIAPFLREGDGDGGTSGTGLGYWPQGDPGTWVGSVGIMASQQKREDQMAGLGIIQCDMFA